MKNNLFERAFAEGYKNACIEIYERLLARGYPDEEAKELSGIEEEDVEKSTEIIAE